LLDAAAHAAIGGAGKQRWLLQLRDDELARHPDIQRLLASGERQGVHLRALSKKRTSWYQIEDVRPPDLIISPMSQSAFRVIHNAVGAVPSNSMYGIYLPTQKDGHEQIEALARWLNSEDGQASLRSVARRYGDGLYKLEPRMVERAMVPTSIAIGLPITKVDAPTRTPISPRSARRSSR